MNAVRIRLVDETGIVAEAIKIWTWDNYIHVDLIFPGDINHLPGYLGARADGVKIRPWKYANPTKELFGTIPCTDEQARKVYQFATAQLGKGYDWLNIIGLILHKTMLEKNTWICSQLAAAELEYGGITLFENTPFYKITPRDFSISPNIIWSTKDEFVKSKFIDFQ
jgi:hypothetical protein